jgi:formylglycine-generating enzyme required for sulfatase activity
VTQAQWKAVMGANPSSFKGNGDLPVEQVSRENIQEFERKTGLSLPTEAQWEYACRATTTAPIAGTGKLDDMGWYDENSGGLPHGAYPVGGKAPNNFGLHDMQGNVFEWVEDVYDENFYGNPEAREPDPVSVAGSEIRVIRGGSWHYAARHCRPSIRFMDRSGFRGFDLGLRLARPLYPEGRIGPIHTRADSPGRGGQEGLGRSRSREKAWLEESCRRAGTGCRRSVNSR